MARDLDRNSHFALERLRTLMASGRAAAGSKLPTERALSEMFGVSRRSVRRALEVLEADGAVVRRQGAGTFVETAPATRAWAVDALAAESNFMEVMEVRLAIEPQLAQLAAVRADREDLEGLAECLRRIAESSDSDGRELWDGTFHRRIAQCAGNRLYLAMFDLVDRVRQNPAWMNIREKARSERHLAIYASQHDAILSAITARDPAAAGEAMRKHLLLLQENLLRQTSMGLSDAS